MVSRPWWRCECRTCGVPAMMTMWMSYLCCPRLRWWCECRTCGVPDGHGDDVNVLPEESLAMITMQKSDLWWFLAILIMWMSYLCCPWLWWRCESLTCAVSGHDGDVNVLPVLYLAMMAMWMSYLSCPWPRWRWFPGPGWRWCCRHRGSWSEGPLPTTSATRCTVRSGPSAAQAALCRWTDLERHVSGVSMRQEHRLHHGIMMMMMMMVIN